VAKSFKEWKRFKEWFERTSSAQVLLNFRGHLGGVEVGVGVGVVELLSGWTQELEISRWTPQWGGAEWDCTQLHFQLEGAQNRDGDPKKGSIQ
jgi:hypothetical protein